MNRTNGSAQRSISESSVPSRVEPEKAYPGKVVRLGREADRETREFIVDVRVLELPTHWAVGQRAEAYIQITQQDDVLVLPARLIVKRDGAQWRPIMLGVRSRDSAEVVEGVTQGDSVVTPTTSTKRRDSAEPLRCSPMSSPNVRPGRDVT